MANIQTSDLTIGYGEMPVIRNLSLTIEDWALFTLLGPSGCGKTTLLRTIAGFIPVRDGRLSFGERDVTRLVAKAFLGLIEIVKPGEEGQFTYTIGIVCDDIRELDEEAEAYKLLVRTPLGRWPISICPKVGDKVAA